MEAVSGQATLLGIHPENPDPHHYVFIMQLGLRLNSMISWGVGIYKWGQGEGHLIDHMEDFYVKEW